MKDIHIAGTGIWYPEDTISNDEIVLSFNSYVDNFNTNNKDKILKSFISFVLKILRHHVALKCSIIL